VPDNSSKCIFCSY